MKTFTEIWSDRFRFRAISIFDAGPDKVTVHETLGRLVNTVGGPRRKMTTQETEATDLNVNQAGARLKQFRQLCQDEGLVEEKA